MARRVEGWVVSEPERERGIDGDRGRSWRGFGARYES